MGFQGIRHSIIQTCLIQVLVVITIAHGSVTIRMLLLIHVSCKVTQQHTALSPSAHVWVNRTKSGFNSSRNRIWFDQNRTRPVLVFTRKRITKLQYSELYLLNLGYTFRVRLQVHNLIEQYIQVSIQETVQVLTRLST